MTGGERPAHWPWWLVLLPSLVVFGIGLTLFVVVLVLEAIIAWLDR